MRHIEDVEIVYVGDWHEHPGFIEANADHVREALDKLPADRRDRAQLIFTAHSIPQSMAARYPYEAQLHASAALVAGAIDPRTPRIPRPRPSDPRIPRPRPRPWVLVYQSRSGRPGDPWLGPDICDYLRAQAPHGLDAAVICPIGFIGDHIEVLYDLDVEAADTARGLGIALQRAESVNVHPRFVDALADAVGAVWERYKGGRALTVASYR